MKNKNTHFEMVNLDNPDEIIKNTNKVVVETIRDLILGLKEDLNGPGLTWKQLEMFFDEFEKKQITIIHQEHET